MYGQHIGTLNIYANNQRIFSKSGNQDNQWVEVETPILQSGRYMVCYGQFRITSRRTGEFIKIVPSFPLNFFKIRTKSLCHLGLMKVVVINIQKANFICLISIYYSVPIQIIPTKFKTNLPISKKH